MRLIDADALFEEIKMRHDIFLDCEYIGDKARRDELGAFMGDIKNAPTISNWISVKDRLPKKKGDYLICNIDGIVWPYWYNPENKRWYDNCGYLTESVTHWMPLPEPPKEVNEDA